MKYVRHIAMLWVSLFGVFIAQTQSGTIIGLQSDVSALNTGQYYTVDVIIRDAVDVWQVNTIIDYDPSMVYVIGTVSGQPMAVGDFFADQETILIRNGIEDGQIIFTHSLIAPSTPHSGSGTIASFQIYPLAAGTTQVRFTTADLTKINYTEDDQGNRTVTNTEKLPVLPALADFTISGDTVPQPDESTPTPEPTATTGFVGRDGSDDATAEPTLVNVTLAPQAEALPTLIPELSDTSESAIPILPIAVGLLIIGVLGIGVLFAISRRS